MGGLLTGSMDSCRREIYACLARVDAIGVGLQGVLGFVRGQVDGGITRFPERV